jgi:hypothetical protein
VGFRPTLTVALLLLCSAIAGAAEERAATLEHRVKAAFLSKFAGYVEWPSTAFASPGSPIVIGVADSDTIADELEQAVVGRHIGERTLRVQRLGRRDAKLDGNHILFVGRGVERARATEILGLVAGKPILTVTDSESGHPEGSVINFLTAEDKVRFDISREAAERNSLRLASQLLAVARQVKGRGP